MRNINIFKMVLSTHAKISILFYYRQDYRPYTIAKILQVQDIRCSRESVRKFIQRYEKTGTIGRKEGSGRKTKITEEMMKIVNEQMRKDDETTAHQLQRRLERNGYPLHISTILRARRQLGWKFAGSKYCQLIRNENKLKRLHFALLHQDMEFLEKCVFTDECTIQLDTHKKRSYRKEGQRPKLKPKPKHPIKLQIWGGISVNGSPMLMIFDGIMDKFLYVDILRNALKPFHDEFPDMWLQADNDPKHTSNYAIKDLEDMGMHWFRTPAESPDMNPIENIWQN